MKRSVFIILLLISFHYTFSQNIVALDTFRSDIQQLVNAATTNTGMDGMELSVIIGDSIPVETFYSGVRAPGQAVDTLIPWHYAGAIAGYVNYVVMKLIDEGSLTMDDSIGMHMDAASMGLDGGITVRQLIRHNTALKEMWITNPASPCFQDIWINNPTVMGCPADILNCLEPQLSSPASYDNNNTNMYVLGYLIDSVTGNSYETEIQNRIFTPFGMTNSFISGCDSVTVNTINGIWTTNSGFANNRSYLRYFSTSGPNRGLISKSEHVAAFYRALFQDKLLSPTVMDSVKKTIPASIQQVPGTACAASVTFSAGYNTDIFTVVFNSGDTTVLYGKGGNGMNGSTTFHWPEKNWTFSLAQNDRSVVFTSQSLFVFDLVCYLRSVDSVDIPTPTGIASKISQDVKVFPNPFNDIITFDFDNSYERPESIIIYNIQGIEIDKIVSRGSDVLNWDSKANAPGVYFYRAFSDNRINQGRIIKQ